VVLYIVRAQHNTYDTTEGNVMTRDELTQRIADIIQGSTEGQDGYTLRRGDALEIAEDIISEVLDWVDSGRGM
jgi:hypothetical protein